MLFHQQRCELPGDFEIRSAALITGNGSLQHAAWGQENELFVATGT